MKVKLLDKKCLPVKAHASDVGFDLKSFEELELKPMETRVIRTGVCIEVPRGFSGDVRPRSGLSSLGILVYYGTVDPGYCGEVKVTITNLSTLNFKIRKYDRIAQLVYGFVSMAATLDVVEELKGGERGTGGFGSTGI